MSQDTQDWGAALDQARLDAIDLCFTLRVIKSPVPDARALKDRFADIVNSAPILLSFPEYHVLSGDFETLNGAMQKVEDVDSAALKIAENLVAAHTKLLTSILFGLDDLAALMRGFSECAGGNDGVSQLFALAGPAWEEQDKSHGSRHTAEVEEIKRDYARYLDAMNAKAESAGDALAGFTDLLKFISTCFRVQGDRVRALQALEQAVESYKASLSDAHSAATTLQSMLAPFVWTTRQSPAGDDDKKKKIWAIWEQAKDFAESEMGLVEKLKEMENKLPTLHTLGEQAANAVGDAQSLLSDLNSAESKIGRIMEALQSPVSAWNDAIEAPNDPAFVEKQRQLAKEIGD